MNTRAGKDGQIEDWYRLAAAQIVASSAVAGLSVPRDASVHPAVDGSGAFELVIFVPSEKAVDK